MSNDEPLGSLSALPEDVLIRLQQLFFSATDVLSLGMTCKCFHQMSQDESIWASLFVREFGIAVPDDCESSRTAFRESFVQKRWSVSKWRVAKSGMNILFFPFQNTSGAFCWVTRDIVAISSTASHVLIDLNSHTVMSKEGIFKHPRLSPCSETLLACEESKHSFQRLW